MARHYFPSAVRLFQHRCYCVLVKELYNPWADYPGKPSNFIVFYVDSHKKLILEILARLSLNQINDNLLNENGVRCITIDNSGFFSKHDINWAVEEAKRRI